MPTGICGGKGCATDIADRIEAKRKPSLMPEPVPEQPFAEAGQYEETELLLILEEQVKNALMKGETELDLMNLQIYTDDYDLYKLIYFSPYLSNGIDLQFWSYSNGLYAKVVFTNSMTIEETSVYFNQVDTKLNEISKIPSREMSAEEKALAIHDYLIYNYEYDYDDYQAGTLPKDSYRSGGLLMKGTGVCQAYAYSYKYIMNMLGIECHVTGSEEMNHAWNIINIDGAYYHVDCTWDDPIYDRLGMVGHTYFLLSDQKIQEGNSPHTGWDLKNLSCNNTKFDNAYWQGVETQIVMDNQYVYYIADGAICKRNIADQSVEKLKNLGRWYVWNSSSYWLEAYSGLFMFDGDLYYNTSTEIRKISIDGTNDELVYAPDTSNGYAYGSRKHETEIQYVIKQSPTDTAEKLTAPVSLETEPIDPPEPEEELPFTDVKETEWYYEAVKYVYKNKIIQGLTETTFGPDVTLTRAQFATILYRVNGEPVIEYSAKFPDIVDGQWYTDGVLWANSIGVVSGYANGLFGPDDSITREQMAVMMYRYAKYKEYDISKTADISSFADASEVSSYAQDAFKWAVGSEIISGKAGNMLEPQGEATRVECAAIMMRFMEKYEK